ncbi:MAG: sigma-70 family RNA polymerase sigma factor [Lachnospiraceae bacterium]|nr:sigma-70 family RNA polymerase sigma factor [Lachnospiraceae bacterium]
MRKYDVEWCTPDIYALLYREAKRIAGDYAEDIVQTVLCNVLGREEVLTKLSAEEQKAYLLVAVRNQAIDKKRCMQREQVCDWTEQVVLPASSEENPEELVLQQERKKGLWQLVDELPVRYRQVIRLCYQEQQKPIEIAQKLDLKRNTVDVRLKRGLAMLREMMPGKQLLGVIILICSLTCITTCVIQAVENHFYLLSHETTYGDGYVEVNSYESGVETVAGVHLTEFTYLPEGYTLEYEERHEVLGFFLAYRRQDGKVLTVDTLPLNGSMGSIIDTDYRTIEHCQISGRQIDIMEDLDGSAIWMWEENGYLYFLHAVEDRETIQRIVEGMKIIKK